MKLTTIHKREKVTDQVFGKIKSSFLRGELKPGDKLPGVYELAEKLGAGVTSVREAIKMLEILGAVESRQGEGTFVCSSLREGAVNAFEIQFMLLPQTADYLAQFREMYETAYTKLAMYNATSEDLDVIETYVKALEDKAENCKTNTLIESKDELDFHTGILKCTHNPYVIKIGEVSLALFFDIANERLTPLKITDAATDHRNILQAMRNKDTKLLQEVFDKSFSGWKERFSK
jgi:GntR family transcriptional repressor for pyruvate dehydrogenase complex